MRIAHTESSIRMGGQELRILDQIRWMLDQGHSAWLLARKNSAIYEEAIRRNIPTHIVPFRGAANPPAVFEIARFVRDEGIQLIDCHDSTDACSAMMARLFGIPIVRTLHVYEFKTDLVHKFLWRHGNDHVIVVSQVIADMLVTFGYADRRKISVIPTGIDLNRFRPDIDNRSIRREFNIPGNNKVISIIGMIRPDKGQKCFIEAVDRISDVRPDVRFLIVGSAIKPEYLADINRDISTLRHRDKVHLTGFRHDVENVIATSDVVVNSCSNEPMSQVIHQAFAMKKLVVASDAAGHASTVRHGETGLLFRSLDAKSLSETVLSVLGNHTQRIREQAYRVALAELGFNKMMEKTLKIYRTIMKEQRPPALLGFRATNP